jgi:hypothetical protein
VTRDDTVFFLVVGVLCSLSAAATSFDSFLGGYGVALLIVGFAGLSGAFSKSQEDQS